MTNGVANPRADTIRLRGKGEKLTPMDIKVFEPMRQKTDGMKSAACAKNNGGCSHLCLAAENSLRYACSCPRGIRLIDDFNCANDTESHLILSVRTGLRKISLDTDDYSDVVVPLFPRIHDPCSSEDEFIKSSIQNSKMDNCTKEFNIVAVDYDPVEAYVYWTDQSFGINRVNLDGANEEQLVIGKKN